jgi:hypothetical protein
MRQCPMRVQTEIPPEGQGSCVTVCVSQDDQDPGGWIIEVWAHFNDRDASRVFVGQVTLGAPNATARRAARVVVVCGMPMAIKYSLNVRAPLKNQPQPLKPLLVAAFCGDVSPLGFTALNP